MITSALFLVLFTIMNGLLSQLPNITATNPFVSSMGSVSGYLTSMNQILPIDSVLLILVFYTGFEGFYLLFKAVYWVIRRFPTQS